MKICSLDQWYNTSKRYEWRGHSIVYKEQPSEKETLLLIHGFPTASYDWWKVWGALAKHFSLIAPDMLGFGYSDKPRNHAYTIMNQADLMLDLLESKGIKRFHILAHDYGDTVAQEILARANESAAFEVATACLLNGGIFPEAHHPILIQKLLKSPVGFILSRLLNQRKFERSFSKIFGADTKLTDEELDIYWQLVSKNGGHRIAHEIIKYMKQRVVHRERWVSALQHYPNKLGLINGLEDPISGKVMVIRFKEIISEENIWLFEGIGHYPQVEAQQATLKAYFEFLK